MRLTDLQPEWLEYIDQAHRQRFTDAHSHVAGTGGDNPELDTINLVDADGILFLCPTCFVKNGGPVRTESVLCWFVGRGVPDDALPGPGRWAASGTGFGDLTLTPSVNVDHEHWHGHITNGEIK